MFGRWKYSGRHSVADFQTTAGVESPIKMLPPLQPQQTFTDYLQRKVAFRQEIIDRYFEIHKESISIFFDVKCSTLKPFDISLTLGRQGRPSSWHSIGCGSTF